MAFNEVINVSISRRSSRMTFGLIIPGSHAAVTKINGANLDGITNSKDVVFLNFYADWCRFSQMLSPIFEEASNKFDGVENVVFGSVNCDLETDVAQKYRINKYPTLKLIRNGQVAKREFRGQRSADAIAAFINEQLVPAYHEINTPQDLNTQYDSKKRTIIAYFLNGKSGKSWENLNKVAALLREECSFFFGFGPNFQEVSGGGSGVAFRPTEAGEVEQKFTGDPENYEYVSQWITDKCIPLVREITFENAEGLTEEGLPFLILFRRPDDEASLEVFSREVAGQLTDQRTAVNFLVADGNKFAHPLHHLGKTIHDLPVLAIDSFRHMYLFPDFKQLEVAGKLRQFVMDLHSGKLHREFHHGPDPTQQPSPEEIIAMGGDPNQLPVDTQPPPSVFQKLKPAQNHYTLLDTKDEL